MTVNVFPLTTYKGTSSRYQFNDKHAMTLTEAGQKLTSKGQPISIVLPLVMDTEFVARDGLPRKRLTIQVKTITDGLTNAVVYDDWDSIIPLEERQFQSIDDDNVLIDFVRKQTGLLVDTVDVLDRSGQPHFSHHANLNNAVDISFTQTLPVMVVQVYAHFAIAELFTIFKPDSVEYDVVKRACSQDGVNVNDGDMTGDIDENSVPDGKKSFVYHARRTRTETRGGERDEDGVRQRFGYIELGKVVVIDGVGYRLALSVIDTSGMATSLANLYAAGQLEGVEDKELFTRGGEGSEISRMHEMYVERPKDFEDYSLNDLYIYEAMKGINKVYQSQRRDLGLDLYRDKEGDNPHLVGLTTGKHVANVITDRIRARYSKLFPLINLGGEVYAAPQDKPLVIADSSFYSKMTNPKTSILAKTNGGRCGNNKPTTPTAKGALCDIDIAGAYGDGMRQQVYAIGRPRVRDLHNVSLAYFLKNYKHLLVDGNWMARFDAHELKYEQDFFPSWIGEHRPEDGDVFNLEEFFDVRRGDVKVFQNQIVNGLLTSDGVDWIMGCSQNQRGELMKKIKVVSFAGHFKDDEYSSEDELLEALEAHQLEAQKDVVFYNERSITGDEFYGWIGVKLSDLCIDAFMIGRQKARKKFGRVNGKKSAEEESWKLLTNTTYGVMASSFFPIGSVIAANNVTARCRAFIWYNEKGLNCYHSITDGGVFDLNKVVYEASNRNVPFKEVVNGDMSCANKHYRVKPLLGDKTILSYEDGVPVLTAGDSVYKGEDAKNFINEAAMKHLQSLFPRAGVLSRATDKLMLDDNGEPIYIPREGAFSFEVKDFYDKGGLHGTSNYILSFNDNWMKPKFRSYESNRPYYPLDNRKPNPFADGKNPAVWLMEDIVNNPNKVWITPPFRKSGLIKPNDYRNRRAYFDERGLIIGDSYVKCGRLNPFSISQFQYCTYDQYKTVEKIVQKAKDKYGWSYERFFAFEENGETYIRYADMIEAVEKMIRAGDTDIKEYTGLSRREYARLNKLERPQHDLYKELTATGSKKGEKVWHLYADFDDPTYMHKKLLRGGDAESPLAKFQPVPNAPCEDVEAVEE